jgi:hypothetical protein
LGYAESAVKEQARLMVAASVVEEYATVGAISVLRAAPKRKGRSPRK